MRLLTPRAISSSRNIPLGGGAGENTVYDSVSGHILVAVHGVNLLVVIDPATNQIVSRIPLNWGQETRMG